MLGQLLDAGNTTTLSHYLELLDMAGLLGGIEKFTRNILRQRSSSPKFQVYNNALISVQHPSSFKEIRMQPEQWGRWVESAIGAHLMNHTRMGNLQLFYWRHRNNEVDFVLEYRGKVIGLEVKSGAQQKASGMKSFQTQMHPDKVLLVGKEGLPWEEFLQINPIELF
jgi:predicted AAA+ superfamily ATPase